MVSRIDKKAMRLKRHVRVRGKVSGTPERPRLNEGSTGNCEAAKKVGTVLAERAKAKGIEEVVFDRGGYVYHGRVAALAEGAREGGLQF